jgi:hypothetical protein
MESAKVNPIRWIARVVSVLNLAILLTFIIGEFSTPGPRPTSAEWVGLAFFPIGIIAGLVLGWLSERWGGACVVVSLAGFYVWYGVEYGSAPRGPFFFLFSVGGFLFLLSSVFR